MELPGGILIEGRIRRGFRFKPVTGYLEMALNESAEGAETHPSRVTAALCQALQTLGDDAATVERVWGLSVGDRQFLMQRLSAHINDGQKWLTAECGACGEPFDVSFRYAELPVKPAGPDYPETAFSAAIGRLRLRAPTGADQEAVAAIADEAAALRVLLTRLVSAEDPDRPVDASQLTEAEIAAIEARIEAMAPEAATHLLARCPRCEAENRVPVSPYGCLERPGGELYGEIHQLARGYHWSEHDILSLPRRRRRIYLRLIDRNRGMRSAEPLLETA